MRGALEQGLAEGREKGLTEGREQGISEGKEQGISEGREQGITEGIEKGEELAFEKILLLLQDIKTNKIPDAELSSKYNVKETYVAQIRLSTQ
jgi:flagellar biosynthesis/type III secretory pathway protein FliH